MYLVQKQSITVRNITLTFLLLCTSVYVQAQVPDSLQKNTPVQLKLNIQLQQATDSTASDPAVSEFTLGGMVIDETVSKVGHDFFELFFSGWEEVPGAPEYLLLIRERPMPSLGSIVTISIDGEVLWEQRLGPQREVVEMLAQEAVFFFQQYLLNYNQIIDAQKTDDLEGSGIY